VRRRRAGALATARAKGIGRRHRRGAQLVAADAQQAEHGPLGSDPRMARGADAQVIVNRAAIGVRQFAVDERSHEGVEISATMH
jgi:hypothetical protein